MTQSESATLVQNFYSAFSRRDADAMAACYHPEARFRDPVFGELNRESAISMWRMLTEAGKDLRVTADSIQVHAGGSKVTARWTAVYSYRPGPNRTNLVTNQVSAAFEIRDGLILNHVDEFDVRTWIGMAFAPQGRWLALLPPFRALVRRKARQRLESYMASLRTGVRST